MTDTHTNRRSSLLFWFLMSITLSGGVFYRSILHSVDGGPVQPAPDFHRIAQNYRFVRHWMSVLEVESLLGPGSDDEREAWMIEIERIDKEEYFGPKLVPRWTQWRKWQDPENPQRWIAIYFYEDKVYMTYEHGL